MILQIDDWIFDINMEPTMERSALEAKEHCECGYCRNYYAAMDVYLPGLRPLLTKFGIDAQAPDMLYPYDVNKDQMYYEGEYVVFGSIVRFGKRPLNWNGADMFLIAPVLDDDYDVPEPQFVLSLDSAELPRVLDEPMEEVVSPANEPTFLQKMWDRVLKIQPKRDMNS